MAARKIGKIVVDWSALSAKIPLKDKALFGAFRAKYDAAKSSLLAVSETPPAINWDTYKKQVANPGLVDVFQTKFGTVKVPFPEDTYTAALQEKFKGIEEEYSELFANSQKDLIMLNAELNKLESQKPYEEMTIDEYMADNPEGRKKVEEDKKSGKWLEDVGIPRIAR